MSLINLSRNISKLKCISYNTCNLPATSFVPKTTIITNTISTRNFIFAVTVTGSHCDSKIAIIRSTSFYLLYRHDDSFLGIIHMGFPNKIDFSLNALRFFHMLGWVGLFLY